jgi:FtsZ-interacting cell division protein ZipA
LGTGAYSNEENHKRCKEKIPKNKRMQNKEKNKATYFDQKSKYAATIKRKPQIMIRILQFNNRSQPLECGIQTGSRKEEKQYTDNTPETRRLTNNGHKRNPKTRARILQARRQRT